MKYHVIAGEGTSLEQAYLTACESGDTWVRLELQAPDHHNFDLEPLFQQYAVADTEVFLALDERAVNFARHKLIAAIRLAGYRLLNIVSPRANVAADVKLMGNVYIGPGCDLAERIVVGTGSWLNRRVIIEPDVRLGNCVTLHAGVALGAGSDIGIGSTLGYGCFTAPGTKVGRYCEWLLPGLVPGALLDRSFYDPFMPEGARILNV